jgi:hypothetical protein
MFERPKTIFKGKENSKAPAPHATAKFEPKAPDGSEGKAKKADKGKAAAGKPTAAAPAVKPRTPEEMCGITSKMGKEEIRTQLAMLYKRYNRATSSLNAGVRAEAEEMLDAIVAVREKIFGAI